jgi:hypothetical protein
MSKKNPKATMQSLKSRLVSHPLALGVAGAMAAGGGNRVGEPVNNFVGDFAQPYFDMISAHPNGAPAAGAAIGAGVGVISALVAQRRDAKAYHQQQNVAARTASLNPHITRNYKNPK